jgi:signal transduction histidine kinase
MSRSISLRWQLVSWLVLLQAAILTVFLISILGALWWSGHLLHLESEDATIDAIAAAAARGDGDRLVLRPTRELARLKAMEPGLWFMVRDRQGQTVRAGDIPSEFASVSEALAAIGQARLGWNVGDPPRPTARFKRVETAAGTLQILTGPGDKVPLARVVWAGGLVFGSVILPILVLMAIATLVATPMVVRKALAGVSEAAEGAQRINADQRGVRLPCDNVPTEVLPLVQAVNDALRRLDDGYARRQRFLMDAAHELRTPIAILSTRLESLSASPEKQRLLADVARLANLAEQLLDLQRMDHGGRSFMPVDLIVLGRTVAADLAPLAIAAGFELSFEADSDCAVVVGDVLSLQRALTNLVQNAIEHAGRGETITIRIERTGVMEVSDEGNGIPPERRTLIFEPFQRLRPQGRGAGLGLHLVSEIVRLHQGSITVLDGRNGGARFRIALPSSATAEPAAARIGT